MQCEMQIKPIFFLVFGGSVDKFSFWKNKKKKNKARVSMSKRGGNNNWRENIDPRLRG